MKLNLHFHSKIICLFCIFLPTLAFALSPINSTDAKKIINTQNCPKFVEADQILDKWINLALRSDSSIGCPSTGPGSAISNLEIISQQDDRCADKAKVALIAFYSIFTSHPNYAMCGLIQKQEILISEISEDGKICIDQPTNKIYDCFITANTILGNLKARGELKAAFVLAKKIANSNDVTGVSQLILGLMYYYGEGTDSNLSLGIKWLKVALEKSNDKYTRINAMISLAVSYEDLGDIGIAKQYFQQCGAMGDADCIKGLARLNKK